MIQLYQTLDLRPIGIPQTLRLSQYDSDFEIIFELTNFDGAWILDTNTTAEVQGTKTDGHGYSADAVFDDQLKTVTIAGDVQMTAAAGRNTFEVVLFHDGDRLGSKNFILDVERAALDAETTASDSKIKNFTEMTEAAEAAAETATAAAETATAAAEAAEQAASEFSTDTTLSIPGKAADAKATGDAIAAVDAEVEDVRIGADSTVYPTAGDAVRDQITNLKDDLEEISEIGKNKFDVNNYGTYNGYFSSSTPIMASSSTSVTVYTKCKPNTKYTVSKIQTSRFSIGFTSDEPITGISITGAVSGNGRLQLISESDSESKYIVVYLYINGSETPTLNEVLASLLIEEGNIRTEYAPYELTAIDVEARNELEAQFSDIGTISFTDNGYYHKNTGVVSASAIYSYSEKVKIPSPITKLRVHTAAQADNTGIVFWDCNGDYVYGENLSSSLLALCAYDVDVPVNAVYVGFACNTAYASAAKLSIIDTSGALLQIARKVETLNDPNRIISDESITQKRWYDSGYYTDYVITDVLHKSTFSLYNSTGLSAFDESVRYKGYKAVRCSIPSDGLEQRTQLRYTGSNRLDLMGAQEVDIAVYLPDVTKIASIAVTLYVESTDGSTQNSYNLVQSGTLNSGWNHVRYAVPHTVAKGVWELGYNVSVTVTASSATFVFIGEIVMVKPGKAKVIFVDDHAYKEFMNNAYTPYFKPAEIPVTWAIQPGRLGTVIANTGTLLEENDVVSLASDPFSEISWHSWDASNTSSMTAVELKTENMKCLAAIRRMGVLPQHFWRAAWKQNDAPNAMACADDLPAFASWHTVTDRQIFPFVNRYDILRFPLHSLMGTMTDGHYTNLDSAFEEMHRTHRIYIFYTHSCLDDPSTAGAGSISPSQAEYFANLCADAMDDGWLECLTFNQLSTRYHY